ncbi:hypothetical protein lbkm_1515 [Lachnospiraceae bacterium KM106-2]|nr:hypothetical protein lbkm_1515 [Lachnospiraceae bacterium KM106-2]
MNNLKKLTLSAIFIAIGLLLPFFTGQIPAVGKMLLPMHIPVLLCGLLCGWQFGGIVGVILPLFRFLLFGMPPIYPTGIAMALELATYGIMIGYLYEHSKWKCIVALYRCMIIAMIAGRVVWGIAEMILLGVGKGGFTMKLFVAGAFLNAVPGIIIQLILIPAIMITLNQTGLVRFQIRRKRIG